MRESPARSRWVSRLDALTIASLAAAVLIDLTGGFSFAAGGFRFSARAPFRALMLALLLTAVRHALQPRPSFLHPLRRRLARLSDPLAAAPGGSRALDAWGAFALFAALTVILLWPQASALASVPDRGDPLFSIWRLSWTAHQVVHDPGSLFHANIFHPEPFTLAYSDAMLLPALIAAPAFWLGAPPAIVYNIALLACFAASGTALYALARDVTGSRAAALAGGAAFAFHAYRFAHYSHFELQVSLWMPLALLALLRAVRSGRARDGALAGLLVAAQAYSSIYYAMFFAVYASAFLALLWFSGHVRPRALRALAACAIAAATALPLAYPYLRARAEVGARDEAEVRHYSAEARDYLAANGKSRWYRETLRATGNAERQLFPGIAVLVLAAAGLTRVRNAAAFAVAGSLVVAVDCSLGLNGVIYPWLHGLLPPFQGLRSPARFGTLVAMSLSLLAAFGAARLLQAAGSRKRLGTAIAAASVAAIAIDAAPVLPLQPLPLQAPGIYRALPETPGVVLAELPFPASPVEFALDPTYMYYSTFHWRPLVNGNSGYMPPWYPILQEALKAFPSDVGLRLLREHGATHIIVHGEFLQAVRYAEIVAALARRGDVSLLAIDTTAGQESRLYALAPAPAYRSDDGGTIPFARRYVTRFP